MPAPAPNRSIAEHRAMSGACWSCVHRRELPGNTHFACHHPATEYAHKNALAGLIAAQGGALPMPSPVGQNVQFDTHGIRMGWASWPFNFDPTWLVECDGFAAKPEG